MNRIEVPPGEALRIPFDSKKRMQVEFRSSGAVGFALRDGSEKEMLTGRTHAAAHYPTVFWTPQLTARFYVEFANYGEETVFVEYRVVSKERAGLGFL